MKIIIVKYLFVFLFFLGLMVGKTDAHVQLDYPKGGEKFLPGQIVTIQWHRLVEHEQENWDLFISTDGGLTWTDLALDLPIDQMEYSWSVPVISSGLVRIKVEQDNTVESNYGSSSENFTIGDQTVGVNNLPDQVGQENRIFKVMHEDALVFRYGIQKEAQATLTVYDLNGRSLFVRELALYPNQADEVKIACPPVRSGLYLCKVRLGLDVYSDKVFFD